MREHFVSNKDVIQYDLSPFVQSDKYGRYKLPKYFLRKLSNIITDILSGFLCVKRSPGRVGVRGDRRIQVTFEEIPELLLNPDDQIKSIFEDIQRNWDKDLMRNRAIKIWNIKKKMKQWN
jgi:hypothetical protein